MRFGGPTDLGTVSLSLASHLTSPPLSQKKTARRRIIIIISPVPAVVYGRCSVSLEPGERGAAHEATVLSNGPPRAGEEGEGGGEGEAAGGNRVRREFFERHR